MPRTATYPSRKIVLADMPEVQNMDSEFRYNFYTKDENISEGTLTVPNGFYVDKSKLANVSPTDTSKYDRFVSRYVLLTWDTIALPSNSPNQAFEEANANVILENLDSIYSESSLTLDEFSVISFRDTNTDGRTKLYAKLLTSNEAYSLGISASLDEMSLQQISLKLSDAIPQTISTNFISEVINQPKDYGITFLDDDGFEQVGNSLLEEISSVEVRSTINNRFLYDIVKSSVLNPESFYGDELAPSLPTLKTIQQNFRSAINPAIVSGKDYDFELDKIIDYRVLEDGAVIPEAWKPNVFCTGYLIEKYRRDSDGSLNLVKSMSVENPSQGYIFDDEIKYGDVLQYGIYSIFVAQTFSTHPNTGERLIVRFLIKSKPRYTQINCIETTAPSTPADFSINWDYSKNSPVLYWSMPLNPQRDIKFFKIYKRNNINESFKLLTIYDFNDLISPPNYNMPSHLVKKMNSPETIWLDYSFTKDSPSAIYAIVSVDARGLVSEYSEQLSIRFNKTTNKLDVKQIADAGAPPQYPNLTLDASLFSDTIKTSGAKKLKVYFEPEYYSVFGRTPDGKKLDLGLLATQQTGGYSMQFINLDLQEQASVNILLQDNRIKPNIIPLIQDVPSDPTLN